LTLPVYAASHVTSNSIVVSSSQAIPVAQLSQSFPTNPPAIAAAAKPPAVANPPAVASAVATSTVAKPPAVASASLLPPQEEEHGSSAYAMVLKKKSVAEMGRDNRIAAAEKSRTAKRDKQRNKIRFGDKQAVQGSSLAAAAGAGVMIATLKNGQPVLREGKPVTYEEMQQMIHQFMESQKLSYDEACKLLSDSMDEQQFVDQFASLLSNPSEAWRTQEQEISFTQDDIDQL